MPFKDKDAQLEYQRQWMARRRAEYFKGKTCVSCGSDKDLELDHIDPEQKVSHKIWSWSATRRIAELAKCQVLCQECHMEKTDTQRPNKPVPHGGGVAGRGRCKCQPCVDKRAEYRKSYYSATKR